jgi:hypothetical protein
VPSSSYTSRVIPLPTAVRSSQVHSPTSRQPRLQLPLTGTSPDGGARIWLSASEEAVHHPVGFGWVDRVAVAADHSGFARNRLGEVLRLWLGRVGVEARSLSSGRARWAE